MRGDTTKEHTLYLSVRYVFKSCTRLTTHCLGKRLDEDEENTGTGTFLVHFLSTTETKSLSVSVSGSTCSKELVDRQPFLHFAIIRIHITTTRKGYTTVLKKDQYEIFKANARGVQDTSSNTQWWMATMNLVSEDLSCMPDLSTSTFKHFCETMQRLERSVTCFFQLYLY